MDLAYKDIQPNKPERREGTLGEDSSIGGASIRMGG